MLTQSCQLCNARAAWVVPSRWQRRMNGGIGLAARDFAVEAAIQAHSLHRDQA